MSSVSTQLTQEIIEALNRNMPAAMSDVIAQRLEQAKKMEEEIDRLKTRLASTEKSLTTVREELNAATTKLSTHVDLDYREKVVARREQEQQVADLNTKLAAAKDNAEFARSVALGLVRNTEYRRTLSEQTNTYGTGNDYGKNANTSHNIDDKSTAA